MAQYLDNFRLENINGIEYYGADDAKGNFQKGGLAVWLDKHVHVFDSDRFYSELRYLVNANTKQEKTCRFDSVVFAKQKWAYFQQKGVSVTFRTQQIFEGYIEHLRSTINHIDYAHDWVGWDTTKNCHNLSKKPKEIYKHSTAKLGTGITSSYTGMLDIQPKGSWKEWKAGVEEHVMGYRPLESAIIMGLSAVVVGYLGNKKLPPNLIFHIPGRTSTGKSTAAMLAASTSGSPHLNAVSGHYTLFNTWNSTSNGLYALLRGNRGIVMCFDELGTSDENHLEQTVYKLYAGNEKIRLHQSSQLPEEMEAYWNTTLITTGEELYEERMSKKPDGASMRYFQFSDLKVTKKDGEVKHVRWTKSAKNARAIQKFTKENYGHAAPLLAKYITQHASEIDGLYEKLRRYYLKQKGKNDTLSERRADFMGMVLLTAHHARKALDIPFNYKKICDFFILNEDDFQAEHLHAYKYLCELVSSQRNHFWDKDNKDANDSVKELWGTVQSKHLRTKDTRNGKPVVREIAILSTMFEKLLEKQNFSSDRVINGLREDGLLSCEPGKHRTRTRVDPRHPGVNLEYYVINVYE